MLRLHRPYLCSHGRAPARRAPTSPCLVFSKCDALLSMWSAAPTATICAGLHRWWVAQAELDAVELLHKHYVSAEREDNAVVIVACLRHSRRCLQPLFLLEGLRQTTTAFSAKREGSLRAYVRQSAVALGSLNVLGVLLDPGTFEFEAYVYRLSSDGRVAEVPLVPRTQGVSGLLALLRAWCEVWLRGGAIVGCLDVLPLETRGYTVEVAPMPGAAPAAASAVPVMYKLYDYRDGRSHAAGRRTPDHSLRFLPHAELVVRSADLQARPHRCGPTHNPVLRRCCATLGCQALTRRRRATCLSAPPRRCVRCTRRA